MASFKLLVYFPFQYQAFLVRPEMLYADLVKTVFSHFHIDSKLFLLQIFDGLYQSYVEFDDGYINHLRQRLPRTSTKDFYGLISCRQQAYLLPRQSYFSIDNKLSSFNRSSLDLTVPTCSPPPYAIVWLDEHVALPWNFRSMKEYLFTATLLDGPLCGTWQPETDIDNLIRRNDQVNFDSPNFDEHLKMFTDVDQCRDYIIRQPSNLILLITSGSNGQIILPSIYDKILNTYVLTSIWHSSEWEWGIDYIECLQVFDDDLCMLTRVIRDLARYFVDRASELQPIDAIQYFNWAKKLYLEVDREPSQRSIRRCATVLNYIDNQLNDLEQIVIRTLNEDYDDE